MQSNAVQVNEDTSPTNLEGRKKVFHPFVKRLSPDTTLCEVSRMLLVRAGYASLAMALFTLFRPTPVVLYKVIELLKINDDYKIVIISLLFSWSALIVLSLIVFGSVLVASSHIKSRNVLVLHPWALMLLYFDAFVWLALVLTLYFKVQKNPNEVALLTKMFSTKHAIFIFMYVEICLICILHYIYASWFIIAELTAIELFF